MSDASRRAWLGGLVYISAILCVVGLGRPAFWIDEAHSYEFASFSTPWLVALNAAVRDAYPPLYFVFLNAWMTVSSGEIWMRLSSVFLHLASVPLIYLTGRRLLGPSAGLIAAALLAVSPFHIAFAREARMYSLIGFLALASQLGLLAWIQDKSRKGYFLFAGAGIALLYTHFIGALLLAAQGLALIWDFRTDRRIRRGFKSWLLLVGLLFLPWSPLFIKAFVVTRGYGAEAAPHRLVFYFLSALTAGFEQAGWLLVVSAATAAVMCVLGLAAVPGGPRRRFLMIWAFVPLCLELGAAYLGKPVFGERTLIMSTPAWLLIFAAALAPEIAARSAAARAGAVAVGVLAGLGCAHSLDWGLKRAPAHDKAFSAVMARLLPGDAIVHSSFVTYHPVHRYYLPRSGMPFSDDFLIEPDEAFPAGALGGWFREVWRSVRARLDPHGEIRSGADPNRITERRFAARYFRRVWYFNTDSEGARRLWYLYPAVYYEPAPDKVRVGAFPRYDVASRGFVLERSVEYPGMSLELYRRR